MRRSKSRNRTVRGDYIRSAQSQRPGRPADDRCRASGNYDRKNYDGYEGAGGSKQFQ